MDFALKEESSERCTSKGCPWKYILNLSTFFPFFSSKQNCYLHAPVALLGSQMLLVCVFIHIAERGLLEVREAGVCILVS